MPAPAVTSETMPAALPLRVLLVEDQQDDADLILRALRRGGFAPRSQVVADEAAYLAHLRADVDVVLADYTMPRFDALRALQLVQEQGLDIPFIIVSGTISEDVAVECMKRGAADYLLKDRLTRLGQAVAQALAARHVREEKRHAEVVLRRAHDELEMRVARRTAELAQANEALRRNEELYRTLARNFPNGAVMLFDRDLRYFLAEGRGLARVGLTKEAIEGRTIWEVLPPEECAMLEPLCREALAGHAGEAEVQFHGVTLLVHLLPIENGEGEVYAGMATAQDITARKKMERLKEELISVVSHELRTPLTSLRGFAELMLQREFSPEQQRSFLTIIHSETLRLTGFINDFLDVQRIESGRQVFRFEAVDLEQALREGTAVFSGTGHKHPVNLLISPPLRPVRADAGAVRQVVTNLLSNAVKYSPAGGEITVGARQEWKEVVVWVKDCGIGIPPEMVPNLFRKFYRADRAETRDIRGTGLGLALAKDIVEGHSGRVWVDSEVGRGSTFFFSLPVAA